MPAVVGILVTVGLLWILRTTMADPPGMREANYWLMLLGCVFIGAAISIFLTEWVKR